MTALQKFDTTLRDLVGWLLYRTGVGWLTPFVGVVDFSDFDQLRGAIASDLGWLASLIADTPPSSARDKLVSVHGSLEKLLNKGASTFGASKEALGIPTVPLDWPWQTGTAWSAYGALRGALYLSLPEAAWLAASQELSNMRSLVLPRGRDSWKERLQSLQVQLGSTTPATPIVVPQELQSLWREVDFGRDKSRRRVAKQTTIVQITWTVLVLATGGLTWTLSRGPGQEHAPVAWIVVLFGLLGATVSALRSANFSRLDERAPVETEAVKLRLRPVVGASAALFTYVVAGLGLVVVAGASKASFPLQITVDTERQAYWLYCLLGFLSGFSERWFLQLVSSASDFTLRGDNGNSAEGGTSAPGPAGRPGSPSAAPKAQAPHGSPVPVHTAPPHVPTPPSPKSGGSAGGPPPPPTPAKT